MVTSPGLLQQGPAQRHIVLDHAENEINVLRGGVTSVDGGRKHARIVLLAGAGQFSIPKCYWLGLTFAPDLIQTMASILDCFIRLY